MFGRPYRAFVSFFQSLGEVIQPKESTTFSASDMKEEVSASSSSDYFCKGMDYRVINVYQESETGNQVVFYKATKVGSGCGSNLTIFDECLKDVDYTITSTSGMKTLGPHPIKSGNTHPFAGSIDVYHGGGYRSEPYVCGSGSVLSSVNTSNLNSTLKAYLTSVLTNGMEPFKKEVGDPDCTDYVLMAKILGGMVGGVAVIACLGYVAHKIHKNFSEKKEEPSTAPRTPAGQQNERRWCCARLFILKQNSEVLDTGIKSDIEMPERPSPPSSPRSGSRK